MNRIELLLYTRAGRHLLMKWIGVFTVAGGIIVNAIFFSNYGECMRLIEEQILRANRDFLAELACATETPDIPVSVRQRAQEILTQYPAVPLTDEFSDWVYPAISKSGLEVRSPLSGKASDAGTSSILGFLSDAEKARNACVYAGLVSSALAIGAAVFILLAQH